MANIRNHQYVRLQKEDVLDAYLRFLDENFAECKDKMLELKALRQAKQQIVEQNLKLANWIFKDIDKLEASMLIKDEELGMEFMEELEKKSAKPKISKIPSHRGKVTSIKKIKELKRNLAELKKL